MGVREAYLDYRWGRSVVGTLLIAGWLVSGIAADRDELEWISKSGSAAAREGVPLVETTRGHMHWRDVLIQVVQEEAGGVGEPPYFFGKGKKTTQHQTRDTHGPPPTPPKNNRSPKHSTRTLEKT